MIPGMLFLIVGVIMAIVGLLQVVTWAFRSGPKPEGLWLYWGIWGLLSTVGIAFGVRLILQ